MSHGLDRREHALAAGGVVGTWEVDHEREIVRYCHDAALLLAGDGMLAGRDLTFDEALAGVYTDDLAWLRDQMRWVARVPGVTVREHRVRSERLGIRRVLCRGRTYHDAKGRPTLSLGVVIDITEIEADGRSRMASSGDALNDAAEHGVAAYKAIEATGSPRLLRLALSLLMAIGREIARSVRSSGGKDQKRLH